MKQALAHYMTEGQRKKSSSPQQSVLAVLFDFDGTLAVPTLDFSLMREQVKAALRPFSSEAFHSGSMVMEEIERITAPLPFDVAEQAKKAAFKAIEDVEYQAARRSSLFPFVRPMLYELQKKGIFFGIITRNMRASVAMVFPDLAQLTSCILTREDVVHVKPHPEHLITACSLLGISPESALMVGDHPTDIIAGKNAGTMTAGVGSGEASLETLALEKPDYLATHAGELLHMLGLVNR